MDDLTFIQAIQASPGDEIPRLVYADWLDDQGDPRGELIRVQCEIARRPANDLERKRLQQRADELLEDYGELWLDPLRQMGAIGVSACCFHRGLLERLKIPAGDFLQHAEALCQIEPALTCVQLTNLGPHLSGFVNAALPAQIIGWNLNANPLTSLECRTLAASAIARQVQALDLKFCQLDDECLAELCLGTWPALLRLDLSSNRIGPNGAKALANQSAFPQLRALTLSMNPILSQGATALFESNAFTGLEELHLASTGLANDVVSRIMDSARFPALKILNLRFNRLGIAEQTRLNQSPLSRRLQHLDLTGNERPSSYPR